MYSNMKKLYHFFGEMPSDVKLFLFANVIAIGVIIVLGVVIYLD